MRLALPTGGLRTPKRRERLLAVAAIRDDARFLPGLLENLAPQVDGLVALDDGSTDESGILLGRDPITVEVLSNPVSRSSWDEVGNHRRLITAALAHGATWVLAIDADERVEDTFRDRAERAIRRGRALGLSAFRLPLHDLWGDESHYRVDGLWGRKSVARLFRARPDHAFDTRPLHAHKAPLQARRRGRYAPADARIYHLRMILAEDRTARQTRYEALDPGARWQPGLGYGYLTDDSGLELAAVPRGRGFTG